MFRKTLKPLCLAGLLDLCVLTAPAWAQSATSTQQLVNQANYLQDQGREDLAGDVWRKVLAVDPVHADALLGLGLIELNQGRRGDAQKRLQQLQARHPGAAQTTRLRQALNGGAASTGGGGGTLQAARAAGAAGRYAEAIKAYDEAFGKAGPPSNLALEYYQVLAGTPEGWSRAREGLRGVVAADAGNNAARLALAKVLTYREPSRREGIGQLRTLSGVAETAAPARSAWRQALLWLNASTADAGLFQAFLDQAPNDTEIAARKSQLRGTASSAAAQAPRDPRQQQRGEGFAALEKGDVAVAEARFAAVLRQSPRDGEALGGLGSVRLRQQRFAEADVLLQRAVAINGKWRSAANTARYWSIVQDVQREAGADAIKRLQQAIALLPREPTAHVLLADLQAGSDEAAAERSYRRALELDAGNAGALQGLAGLLGRQGRAEQASALFAQLSPQAQERAGGQSMMRANLARARAQQAIASGSLEMAQIELEDAMLQQPNDPWLRLELARLYHRLGRPDRAASVMSVMGTGQDATPQSLHALALYAQDQGDWANVYRVLEQIPAASRDARMNTLHDQAWVQQQAAQARGLMQGNRLGEAQLLLARTESSLGDKVKQPEITAALAAAYADIGSQQRALVLAQRLLEGNPGTESRLQYAEVLLRARQEAELAAMLRQLGEASLSVPQQQRLQALRSGYTLRQVDGLRELGNLEGAYELLAPLLAESAQDPEAIAALARLYAAAGEHEQALALYQQQLQLAPGNLDAMLAAAASAAALRDLDTAENYLEQALARAPQSPEVLAAAGRVYRAAGKNRRAETYFKAAIAAARSGGQNGVGGARSGNPFAGSSRLPSNPFAGLSGGSERSNGLRGVSSSRRIETGAESLMPEVALPRQARSTGSAGIGAGIGFGTQDVGLVPLAAEGSVARRATAAPSAPRSVADELRELRADSSSAIAVGASYRGRDGEGGLGRLDDLEVPLEGRFEVGDGKLLVGLTPTVLDAGSVDAGYTNGSRFGGGPQAALAGALGADRSAIDSMVGTSLYQALLTNGASTATRNLIYTRALNNGRYQELFNDTDATLTDAERKAEALALLYQDALPSYLLSNDLAGMTISQIASQLMGNSALLSGLTASEQAQLKGLAQSSNAGMTAQAFQDTLYAMAATAATRLPGSQDASGAGISVGYERGGFRADIGSTPLGFAESNVVGGLSYRGRAGDSLTWSAEASRRAVNDSLLSFAGAEDARTGLSWGGVTASGARIAGTVDDGLLGGYASAGWHRLSGNNVADNERLSLGAGVYVHALEEENQSVTAGLNLTAMRYDRNLSGFTYGQGGYFSPQRFIDLSFPLHWNGRNQRRSVSWQLDASVGVQNFKEEASDYFPNDPAMQAAAYEAASLAAMLGISNGYVEPVYAGQTKTGVSYNLSAAAEWQLSSQLFLGGRMEFNNARDYRQFGTNLYLRFLLDRLGSGLGKQPQPLRSPYAEGM